MKIDKTQFSPTQLPVTIETIWDEVDGEEILKFVVGGEVGVSGYLILYVEMDKSGMPDQRWHWLVNEPQQNEAYKGSETLLWDAAESLKSAMEDMAQFVRERDGI